MIKLTKDMKEFLIEYALEFGSIYKEHRRGSTFYISADCLITSEVFADALDDDIRLPQELNGLVVALHGTWSDDDGTEVGCFEIHSHQQIMNPKYVALMTRAQEDELLTDFIKEHCGEYIVKSEKVDFEVI